MGFIFVATLGGVFFRFYNIDKKIYWYDEVSTSLHAGGYQAGKIIEKVEGRVIRAEDLLKYQKILPERNVADTIATLAQEYPQTVPLYFVAVHFWARLFGDSPAAMRTFSALMSLLALPLVYWFGWELFHSRKIGWIAVALVAVSPFHILFAQEARFYAQWSGVTLLSSACLLRALRLQTIQSWCLYAITIPLGLYSHLNFLFVIMVQIIYLLVCERLRLTKKLLSGFFAIGSGLAAFIPWALILVHYYSVAQTNLSWLVQGRSPAVYLQRWVGNIGRVFFDPGMHHEQTPWPLMLIYFILFLFAVYALYFVLRKQSKQHSVYLLLLITVPVLPFIIVDLILGGRRALIDRYFFPSYLGIQTAVAYLVSFQLEMATAWKRKVWQMIFVLLIGMGLLSCWKVSQLRCPFYKRLNCGNDFIADFLKRADRPLILVNNQFGIARILSLAYQLDPKVSIQLTAYPKLPKIPSGFSDLFFYWPSPPILFGLKLRCGCESIPISEELWVVRNCRLECIA